MTEYDNRDSGALFKNDKRGNEKAPDYTGEYTDQDGKKRRVAAWVRKSKKGVSYMSLKFSDMQQQQPRDYPSDFGATDDKPKEEPEMVYDDIPF
jgi:hypothetical protein